MLNYTVVLWVDKRADKLRKEGYYVSTPEEILLASYDVILIAAEDMDLKDHIKNNLLKTGIEKEQVDYAKFRKLF